MDSCRKFKEFEKTFLELINQSIEEVSNTKMKDKVIRSRDFLVHVIRNSKKKRCKRKTRTSNKIKKIETEERDKIFNINLNIQYPLNPKLLKRFQSKHKFHDKYILYKYLDKEDISEKYRLKLKQDEDSLNKYQNLLYYRSQTSKI